VSARRAKSREDSLNELIEILLILRRRDVNRIYINSERPPLITIRQVKAARALLGWSQADLAKHSGVSVPTIARLESADGELGGRGDTVRKIHSALDASGVEFINENGGGPGVRLRKRIHKKPSK
jgi:Helix-turn-helix domain